MMDGISSMRYAHSDGHTTLCYDKFGKYIITCGTDGDIRIWKGFDDDDPKSYHIGQNVTAMAYAKGMLYLSSDAFSVNAYKFPKMEFEEIITQFGITVYHITCTKDGKLIASGGAEFIIKVYETQKKLLTFFRGHDGPILSLAIDPKAIYLASSSCDGKICIWQLSDQQCIKTLSLLEKSNDISTASSLCRLEWHPSGNYLAIPVNQEIRFYHRDNWDLKMTFTDECIVEALSIVTFSSSGAYIAASAVNGQMLIWDVKKQECISTKKHEKNINICSLVWNPFKNELAFCDIEGQLGIYEKPLNKSQYQKALFNQEIKNFPDFVNNVDYDDDDDDNAFDIGAIKATLEPKIFGKNDEEIASIKSEPIETNMRPIEIPKVPIQTAFQPSSTPLSLEHRYMLWNTIGIVRSYNTEEENSIDVEFHDSNIYHPLHINNTRNHTMAALSTEALLMASPKFDENTSKLECLHFGTWDSNKEWVVEMSEDEEIEAISLGTGWAAAITDKRFVRLFTISGVQCEVFALPGPVVCCASFNNEIAIAYHKGLGIENDQYLGLMLVKVRLNKGAFIKDYSLPLSSKAFLNWLGYTDEGHPALTDTSGMVYLLNIDYGSKWTPIANSSNQLKNKSDTYFVIGLSEIKQEIRCILCKGSRYPSFLPKPTVAIIPFNLPFCEMTADKGRLEEENRRYSLVHDCLKTLLEEGYDLDSEYSNVEKKWMETLLKMFALATRMEREYRALDIAELMPNEKVLQGAIKYATQRHRIALAEKLGEVMNKKLNDMDTNEENIISPELDANHFSFEKNNRLLSTAFDLQSDNILQPKPLTRFRNTSSQNLENLEESSEIQNDISQNQNNVDTYLISKTSPQVNPFKSSSKLKLTIKEKHSQASIDDLLTSSTKNLTAKEMRHSSPEKKISKQSKLFQGSGDKPKKIVQKYQEKSGFKLFLDKNKDKIIADNIDATEVEVTKIAMKLYKALSNGEKQEYENPPTTSKFSNENVNHPSQSNGETCISLEKNHSTSEKRKSDLDEQPHSSNTSNFKKSRLDKLSKSSVNKLAKFSFNKLSTN